jgi:hypothetical protein
MFKWLNKQGVESDEGFVVQFTGRFTLEYIENGHATELAIESGTYGGLPSIHVAGDSFAHPRTRRAFRATVTGQDEQDRKFDNLRRALDFQGLKLVID